MADKISKNDWTKFYMLQVVIFDDYPAKNKKWLFGRHEIPQNQGVRPGKLVHIKFFLFQYFLDPVPQFFSDSILYICVFF